MSVASNITETPAMMSASHSTNTSPAKGKPKRIQPPAHWGQQPSSPAPVNRQAIVPAQQASYAKQPGSAKRQLKNWEFLGLSLLATILLNAVLWLAFPINDTVMERLNFSAPFAAPADGSLPTPSWVRE